MKVKLVTGWNGLSQEVVDWRISHSSEIPIKTDRRKIDLPAEGLSRLIFLFCDSYFALMWYLSANTQMCKCCNRKWLRHCQGPCCLGRANLAISLLCSWQKECRLMHLHSHFLGLLWSKKSTPKHTSLIPASHSSFEWNISGFVKGV